MSRFKAPDNFPFWTVILVSGLIASAIFACWWLNIEPIFGLFNGVFTPLSSFGASLVSGLNLGGIIGSIQEMFQTNPLGTTVTIVSGLAAVYGILSKVRADNAKKATEEAATEQLNDLDNRYQNRIYELEKNIGDTGALKSRITELESTDWVSQLSLKDTKISDLRAQQNLLMDQLKLKEEELALGTRVLEKVVVK